MARVLTFPGTSFCEICGGMLRFQPRPRMADFAVGECENSHCEMNDKELKVPGTWVEVEEVT